MRRLLVLLAAVVILATPAAYGAAGDGSSDFGGSSSSGSSFDSGSSSSGSSFGSDSSSGSSFDGSSNGEGSLSSGEFLLFLVIVGVVGVGSFLWRRYRVHQAAARREERSRRVASAAAEAAVDDPAFAADAVRAAGAQLFVDVQAAWSANDRARLGTLVGGDLLVEWDRRLADFARKGWRNVVTIQGTPDVHYVGLVNREGEADDRVSVQIDAVLTDVVLDAQGQKILRNDTASTTSELHQYWTLARTGGRWVLVSIEELAEGVHNLSDPIVTSAWGDDRVREDAVLETATADAAGSPSDVASLVDLDYAEDGRKAALDLSLVDGRFAPDVLETSARRAVAAWAEAVDGPDAALQRVARPEAVAQLLYPTGDDAVRRVVRGPQVQAMTLVKLDGSTQPPTMLVELQLSGRRYLENRDTAAVVDGSPDRDTSWTERWTFALDGSDQTPWVLSAAISAASGTPATR